MKKLIKVFLVLAVVASLALAVVPAVLAESGPDVPPVVVDGNPTCQDLGYAYGYKVDPPKSGVYTTPAGTVTVTITDAGGKYFDWSSTFGVDAVIVKGGNAANSFVYDPPAESYGDDGLYSPDNSSGGPAALSHMSFCYDYELSVKKTAETTYTREYKWTIDKQTDGEYHMFTGDSVSHDYTVSVTKTMLESDFAVSGKITITNPDPGFAATITAINDSMTGGITVPVDCGVTLPYVLAAGGKLECTYSKGLPNKDARTNTVTVATTGKVGGGSASAAVVFGEPTNVIGYAEVDVTDDYYPTQHLTGSATWSYSKTFACDSDKGEHVNTATITQTGAKDNATVKIYCYGIEVTKDASTSWKRHWDWTIDKSADQSSLLLSDGQLFAVNYKVKVDAVKTDSDFDVVGNISVYNPAPMAATIVSVKDFVSGFGLAKVECGVAFPYTLAAGDTLKCTYYAGLPNGDARVNTATATLQNSPSGTTDFSGNADVVFSPTPTVEEDECIDVTDTNVGALGTVCAAAAPKTFSYSLWFGKNAEADVVLVCGESTHENVASFVANDSGATGSDSWIVKATVACGTGCTLTPGYWKTHSMYGPAKYDDTWAKLLFGADTPFFLSGKSYYSVLWTPPQGNAYYILAHAYIATELNKLNGASTTAEVDAAFSKAIAWFLTHTPSGTISKTDRAKLLGWASTLDKYNNGLIGPGHCSE